MYQIGDKISHPLHGGGLIEGIVSEKISGKRQEYYLLNFSHGTMTMKVPVEGTERCGVRPIVSPDQAEQVLAAITDMGTEEPDNWNKRHYEHMERIKSGNLFLVADSIKKLMLREKGKGLSTGEYKMLSQAKQIFFSELVMTLECSYDYLEARLAEACGILETE